MDNTSTTSNSANSNERFLKHIESNSLARDDDASSGIATSDLLDLLEQEVSSKRHRGAAKQSFSDNDRRRSSNNINNNNEEQHDRRRRSSQRRRYSDTLFSSKDTTMFNNIMI